jgi:hypothetical protein
MLKLTVQNNNIKSMKYISLIILLMLTACSNFAPIHNKDAAFEEFLSSIEIEEVETLENTNLYHHLSKLFGTSRDTKYILTLQLEDKVSPLVITTHANVLKQNVDQICEYKLVDKSSGVLLLKGRAHLVGSYDSTTEPYTSYTHEQYAKKSITQTTAEELRMRLMLYFLKTQHITPNSEINRAEAI